MTTTRPAAAFRAAIPSLAVVDDATECAVQSADISGPALHPALAILSPATEDDLVAIVRVARQKGIALHPRGGGWSYTAGYRPQRSPAVLVDSSRFSAIAIQRESNTVTTGAGVTWGALHTALEEAGLRATSFGPLSGIGATIGGSAAQNGGFFGTAGYGAMGDGAVCGGTMVNGAGHLVQFGPTDRTDGIAAPQPLVGDCGAFGIRSSVTLRIIPRPSGTAFASFNFATGATALSVLAGLAGLPCLGEAYMFDPGSHANLARSGFSVIETATMAGDLLAAKGGLLGRIGGLIRTARAGRAFVADLAWSLHLALDGTPAEIAATLAIVVRRVAEAGGEVIPDIIPRVTRARPFRRIKALLGPDGESWLPVHGVFAPECAQAGLAGVQAELAQASDVMAKAGLRAVLLAVLMGSRVVIEPQLFWPDALSAVHRRMAQPDQVAAYAARPANEAARAVVHAVRLRLIAALDAAGASHFQIGRSYAGHPGVPPEARRHWAALKTRHDPDGIMNPGALGL